MRLAVLILFLALRAQAAPPADPKAQAVLARAVKATGGEAALDAVRQLRILYVGTQDLLAVYQGPSAEKPSPERRQQTLVMDVPARLGALRTEGIQSDRTLSLWRDTVRGDSGYSLNLKTQKVFAMSAESAAGTWDQWIWSVPHLALRALQASGRHLRHTGPAREDGKDYTVLTLSLEKRPSLRIFFDDQTGLLAGYAFDAPYVEGRATFEYSFKPYRATRGFGVFPAGFRQRIAGRVFRDLDVFDARLAPVDGDPWLEPLPPETPAGSHIPAQTRRAETVAPGVSVLRNVGGYNVLIAAIGDCVAVVDAPASFRVSGPLPPAADPPDLGAQILEMTAQVFPGKPVCWVIPTHHHGDHIGAIGSLARAGAAVITTPGNRDLSRSIVAYGAAGSGNWKEGDPLVPRVETFTGHKVLGEGDARMEIYAVPGTLHADEILFVYFPAHRIAFEGDLGDYVPAAKRFLQFVEEQGLTIDKVYGVHDSDSWTLDAAAGDDPSN